MPFNHTMMDKLEDLDRFLDNVDTISELVEDLKSCDVEVQKKAMERADCYAAALDEPCITKVNETRINTGPSLQASSDLQSDNPENFLKIMQRDAEARRVRRVEREKKATALKDKGNEAYAQEDYETAVKCYTDGLAQLRDMQPLYTNRAQALIKLGRYQEAISDCEWALKCNERCIKAYLHMGKAYLALKKYNESRNCFERIVETEPRREKMIKEYLNHVDLEEKRESQELRAKQEFDRGDVKARTVPLLLEKLSVPGQMPHYYSGGFVILSQAVTDYHINKIPSSLQYLVISETSSAGLVNETFMEQSLKRVCQQTIVLPDPPGHGTGQSLFRLNNGFNIISDNDVVKSCLMQKTKDSESQELCASVLKLWKIVCCGNDENQKTLMTCPVGRQSIVDLITSECPAVQKECLAVLFLFSQTPNGRRLASNNLNVHMLTRNLMVRITKQQQQQQQEDIEVKILENFTTESKYCIQLRNVLTDCVTAPFATILRDIRKSNQHILPPLISSVDRLARDDTIRHSFAHDPEFWKAFLAAIKNCIACEYKEVLYTLLGLIINLSAITSLAIQDSAVLLCDCCIDLLMDNNGGIITRATGVLSTVLPQSPEAVQHVIQQDVVRTMHRLLKRAGHTTTKFAVKVLAVCTAASHLARDELLKSDKKLSVLRHLLASGCDEMVSGNAALCFAHCLEMEGLASNLLGTDVVQLLLRHAAADAKRTAVQKNAAIALGKLCRSEPRHVNKLRELHGLEILHSCMKLIR